MHLTDWPAADELPADDALVAAMDQVREVCSAALALRKAGNLRVRLPLSTLTVVVSGRRRRSRRFARSSPTRSTSRPCGCWTPSDADAATYGVSQRLTVKPARAGPRLGGATCRRSSRRSRRGDWSVADGRHRRRGRDRAAGGGVHPETVAGSRRRGLGHGVLPGGGFVVLDTEVTPELAAEGLARDVVRVVQQARRDAGLDVSDRIALTIAGSVVVQEAARRHEALITGETLAVSFTVSGDEDDRERAVGRSGRRHRGRRGRRREGHRAGHQGLTRHFWLFRTR